MKQLKFLTILFLLLLLTTPVFALTYRTDLNNGSWSQYNSGLEFSTFYDIFESDNLNNRNFENSFDLSESGSSCNNKWCANVVIGSRGISNHILKTSSDYAYKGSQSLKIDFGGGISNSYQTGSFLIFLSDEIVGDSFVNFKIYKTFIGMGSGGYTPPTFNYGYVNDSNVFTSVGSIPTGVNEWTDINFIIPAGEYRFALQGSMDWGYFRESYAYIQAYIDDITITRNNTGTFHKSLYIPTCSSISSCSNTTSHFASNKFGSTWWVIDYVPDAVCSWAVNGNYAGQMLEGLGGMYYAKLDYSGESAFIDLNLTANCYKNYYDYKHFFVSTKLYNYGNIPMGNFEENLNLTTEDYCDDFFCYNLSGITPSLKTITDFFQDGQKGLYVNSSTGSTTFSDHPSILIFSKDYYVGDYNISFFYNKSVFNVIHACSGGNILDYGYVNDSNVFTSVGSIPTGVNEWTFINYAIPNGNYRFAFKSEACCNWYQGCTANSQVIIDNIMATNVRKDSNLIASNSLINNEGYRGDLVTFYSIYKDDLGSVITDANCDLIIDGSTNTMTYNSSTGRYEYKRGFITDGIYPTTHTCTKADYQSKSFNYSINIGTPIQEILTFTPIENINTYEVSNFAPIISINPINSVDDIVFSIISQESASEILFEWFNLSKSSTQQYSVYTSTDGETWVVDETINFGESATYDDPIQKIPRANQHYYSFEDTLPHAEKVYYKIVYNQLPLAWQTIANSNDWVNINQPLVYTDANNYKWDWYADSNYTPIYSYTSKRFPELITSDFGTGFELQFTAFSSSATTLQVGYVIGTTKSVVNVPITTTPKRYSVPIDPTSNEARLLITSEGNNSEVYLTDYAIVPRAYFAGRLNVYNRDGSTLNAIINEGVSKTYLGEGVPFIFETSAYDRDGDLQRLNVQALIGGIVIKSQDFYLSDATKKDKVFTWYETIEGFVDLNGNYINPVGMRDVQIQATLYNTANESVSVQTSTYKILQYPYFQNDLVFNLFSVNAKVGESPKVRFSLQQQDPSQFVGFRVFIYDGEHSIADPNYETTILNDVLKCNSFECSKELEFTEYVYDANQNYRIAFLILLKTENESYTNPLTLKVYNQLVTHRNFETARIFQVFERTDRTYRNDEKIQLVVQLRDEPYKNLLDDTSVYLTIDICSNDVVGEGCSVFGTTKFYPKSKIYDETTGYNYYFFDQLFYDDSGNLFPDGNYIRFQAHISDQRYAHRVADIPIATLGDKCATGYGTLFNYGIFTMNFWENIWTSSERALFGCTTYSSEVISLHDAEEKRILIDADHNVGSGQNHSIACLKVDNENFQNTLEQDLVCAVFWNRNEQSVDKFVFTLGNEFSDYAKSGAEQQYMKFEVPAELIIFNDAFMLQQSLNAEYQTDTIDTLGEAVFYGFDKLFSGIANPLTAIPEGLTRTGMITNVGFDINFSNAFDPTYVKGLYFFKIQGLKVINQYDYINQYPDLERLNPKYFTKFAIDNKIKLPVEDTIVRIYTNDLASFQPVGEQLDALSVRSPLIIFAERSKQQGADGNFIQSITTLRFNLISDMLSNNQTQTQRNFIPFVFSYIVPTKTGFFEIIDDILYGTDNAGNPAGLFTNPINFGFKNWFWFVIILVFLLIASLILKNMRSNGGQITIPVVTPFLENMHTNKVYKRGR